MSLIVRVKVEVIANVSGEDVPLVRQGREESVIPATMDPSAEELTALCAGVVDRQVHECVTGTKEHLEQVNLLGDQYG